MKAEVHIARNVKEDPGHEPFRFKDPFTLVILGRGVVTLSRSTG